MVNRKPFRKGLNQLLGLIGLLVLAACDAGPSAVMPDGSGQSPQTQTQKAPVWAAKDSPPAAPATAPDDEASNPVVATDNPPPAQTAIQSSVPKSAPEPGTATDTDYGQWPLWSSNRQYSALENATYHYGKHGTEFGAKSYEGWLGIVHGFIHHPPKGTQTISRNNGDTLFYDPASNTFAVMTKKGAPRTMFHPDNGAAYWQKQKEIEAVRRTIRDED